MSLDWSSLTVTALAVRMPSTFSVTLISKVERGNLLPEPCAKDPHLGRWTLVPANECVKAPRRQGPSIIKDIDHALVHVRRKGAILVVEQYFEWARDICDD